MPNNKEKLVKLFYENNVRCDQTVEGLADDVESIIADVAEVVHSYWVDKEGKFVPFNEKDGCPARSCYCHRCNDWLTGSDEYPCRGNYCPNCGAKMDLTNS